MATCGGDDYGNWDVAALRSLKWHWSSAYRITGQGDLWHAVPLSAPRESLTARTADDLRDLIRADYFRRTRTQKVITDQGSRITRR